MVLSKIRPSKEQISLQKYCQTWVWTYELISIALLARI
ncbi:hypothetical protein RINTHH_4080 [Richelia intracellularis HH01]|uniref:Uncharacterized protein n=1 Tax=Richelia intracellularis HH01 TaxID=1165094 RepID=M1WZ76_9NOST|nr:hypothetical protein RINTHH_4080 [Richelia intracellularis HH01]